MEDRLRNLVFISHATPEDNTFTIWLSTRLKLMGYEVWSDVTKLFGGEKWWNDIEDAINNYTCKFILVITRSSLNKSGVLRELQLALNAEKINGLPNFIIPIIIDDSEPIGQPHGLSDRNIITFSQGWAGGLARLTKRMTDDRVQASGSMSDLGEILQHLQESAFHVEQKDEIHVTNWLTIESSPEALFFYRVPVKTADFATYFAASSYPWFEWNSMLVGFIETQSVERQLSYGMSATAAPSMNLQAMIDNQPRNHAKFVKAEVVKKINFILSSAWDRFMHESGLHVYELSNGRKSWFFPNSKELFGKLEYADCHGVARKRAIQGHSPKNKVFWHFAIEMIPLYGHQPKLCIYPHVVFTEDGLKPLSDVKKMHRLRRGFCKSWWNDVWRDRILLFMQLISAGEKIITLHVGDNQSFIINARPMMLKSPVSLVGNEIPKGSDIEEDVPDVLVDEEEPDMESYE